MKLELGKWEGVVGRRAKKGGGDGEDLWNREVVIDDCFCVGDLHDNTFMNTYIPHIVS